MLRLLVRQRLGQVRGTDVSDGDLCAGGGYPEFVRESGVDRRRTVPITGFSDMPPAALRLDHNCIVDGRAIDAGARIYASVRVRVGTSPSQRHLCKQPSTDQPATGCITCGYSTRQRRRQTPGLEFLSVAGFKTCDSLQYDIGLVYLLQLK